MADESVVAKTPDVRYTAKDYASLVIALILDWKNRFPGINTDFSAVNYVTAIIGMLAYIGEMLAYTAGAIAREGFFGTAQLSESIRLHAEHIGFEVPGRVASTTQVRLTLEEDSAFSILIPAASRFFSAGDDESLGFQTLRDETIPAGLLGSFIDIWVENSSNFSFSAQAVGDPIQEFVTPQRPVLRSGIDGLGVAVVDNFTISVAAIPYTVVDSHENSEATDTHVIATLTNGGRLRSRFGNGVNGNAPTGEVTIAGRTGGGIAGNNARITSGPAFLNTNNDLISVTVFNTILSSGGADEPSFATVRVQAPQSLKANKRTVSSEDFVINAEVVSGIARALPLTFVDDPAIPLNTTELLVLSESPTNAQITGGNAAATVTTVGVDSEFNVIMNGEAAQLIDVGTQATGADIAAAIELAVRGLTPAFPLDNALAYSGFLCTFDIVNDTYTLVTGQAGLSASIAITAGANDASVILKIDTAQQQIIIIGATPSAAEQAAVLTSVTVTNPTMITHVVSVIGPQINVLYLDFETRFGASANTAALKAATRDAIRLALQTFFAPRLATGIANPEIDYGETMRFSDLISVANGVDGVESINEDTFIPVNDVTSLLREFPVLGGVIVRDASTGLPV